MPNWIEGTMKLRGKMADIKRFFDEQVEPSADFDLARKKKSEVVIDNSYEGYLYYRFSDEPYISDTRRMFITDDHAEMQSAEGVCVFNVKQAWSFNARPDDSDLDALKIIADKYNVDIRLYGIECGMSFVHEVIVCHRDKNGNRPHVVDNVIQYEDWDWECPFPNMGG